jgi:hypothetical protein
MHHGGPYGLPPRRAPFGRRAGQPSEGAPTGTARSQLASEHSRSPFTAAGRRVASFKGSARTRTPESWDLFHSREHAAMARERGTELRIVAAEACGVVFGPTGTDHCEWYACPRLTLFATEWSAARRKRPTAAVLPFSAAIFADVKAVRFRRAAAENCRPAIFEARATLREQSGSTLGRRVRQPQSVPVC